MQKRTRKKDVTTFVNWFFFGSDPKAVLNFQKGDSKRGLTIKRIGNKKRQSTLVTCIEAYKNEE